MEAFNSSNAGIGVVLSNFWEINELRGRAER